MAEVLTAQRVTSVVAIGAPIQGTFASSTTKSIQNHLHHSRRGEEDEDEDEEVCSSSDEEEEIEIYAQHLEEKKACGNKKKLKKKHYRKHEATYLCHQMEKKSGGGEKGLKEVVLDAMLRACKKKYNIVGGEYEYNHALVLAGLLLDPEQPLGKGTQIKLALSDYGEYEAVHGGNGWTQENATEIRISLARKGDVKVVVASSGEYKLSASVPASVDSAAHSPIVGMFDLKGASSESGRFIHRTKMYDSHKLRSIVELKLPSCEMHVELKPKRKSPGYFSVKSVTLVIHLSPDSPAFLDTRSILPCTGNPLMSHHHHMAAYSNEEERVAATVVSSAVGLNEQVEGVIKSRLGPHYGNSQHRFVAHLGKRQIAAVGKGEAHYRIGQCSEIFTCVALIEHLKEMLLGKIGNDINFHDPKLTAIVLEHTGAHHILAGLRKAYKYVGKGHIPSISQILTHQSGLPEYLPVHANLVDDLLQAAEGAQVSRLEEISVLSSDRLEDIEKVLGNQIGEICVPLHAPGARHHHSKLGFAIARFLFKDWHSCHSIASLTHCFRTLGCPTAIQGEIDPARLAVGSPSNRGDTTRGQNEMPLYHTACGYSAKIDELATFLSDNNCWKIVGGRQEHLNHYGFLSHLLVQKCSISHKSGLNGGYGWTHLGVRTKSFMGGNEELRVLFSIGNTPGQHTVLMCMIPALSLSFSFGCNSELIVLLDQHNSIVDFLSQLIGTLVESVSRLENNQTHRASIFNATLNAQLAISPAAGTHSHEFRRKCGMKISPLVLQPQEDPQLKKHFCAGEFICLTEDRPENGASSLTITYETTELPAHHGGGNISGYVLKEKRLGHGDASAFMLAFDQEAFHNNSSVHKAFSSSERGFSFDSRDGGIYRRVDPHDMLLSEHVHFSVAKFNLKGETLAGKANLHESQEPIITMGGRVYVRPNLYDMIQRRVSPSAGDKVHTSLFNNAQRSADVVVPQPPLAEDEYDTQLVSSPIATPQPQKKIASMLKMKNEATPTSSPIVENKKIGPRYGGGWRGGGGWGGGGRGWGYGAGVGLGLGLGAAGLYAAGAYPVVGPAYAPLPYYDPLVYGPYGVRRRFW